MKYTAKDGTVHHVYRSDTPGELYVFDADGTWICDVGSFRDEWGRVVTDCMPNPTLNGFDPHASHAVALAYAAGRDLGRLLGVW